MCTGGSWATVGTELAVQVVAFLVNGDRRSAMAQRAHAFAAQLAPMYAAKIHYREGRRLATAATYIRALCQDHPSVVYVLDLTIPAVVAAFWIRWLTGCHVVIDTGDATAALIRGRSLVGALMYPFLAAYEWTALRAADAVVVRGTFHVPHLERLGIRTAAVIPDGADMTTFSPSDGQALRRQLELTDRFVVGVVGTLNWNQRLQWCPGLELIDALALVQSARIAGLIVGSGSGLARLQARAAQLGVSDRVRFVSIWLEPDALAAHISAMDACLSTQTNNLVGNVRTTGKLPLFMSCGRFVLASRVGEAARVLPAEMLLDYEGEFDARYPRRLAARLDELAQDQSALALAGKVRDIAASEFEYGVLGRRLVDVLNVLSGARQAA